MKNSKFFAFSAFLFFSSQIVAAPFREYPIGDEVERSQEKLKIAAVYFPAVPMDHKAVMPKAGHADHAGHSDFNAELAKEKFVQPGKELIHIEADIHSLPNNPSGFGAGEWIPYLTVNYKLFRKGEKKPVLEGPFMPMIAADGPHYGTTLRMPGKGNYKLIYSISAPDLARHTDARTGVKDYWKPFDVEFDFEYEGLAKAK